MHVNTELTLDLSLIMSVLLLFFLQLFSQLYKENGLFQFKKELALKPEFSDVKGKWDTHW